MCQSSLLENSVLTNLILSSGKYTRCTLSIDGAKRFYLVVFILILKTIFLFFSELTSPNHRAGTPGDESLANKLLNKFKQYGMNTWSDEHFVRVQELPNSVFNKITFKAKEDRLVGFLSYSNSGSTTVI